MAPTRIWIVLTAAVSVMSSRGADPVPDDPSPPDLQQHAEGSFTVVEGTASHPMEVHDAMCTHDAGWADLWVRLAGPAGESGPRYHLDFDLCGAPAAGAYAPKDPKTTRCPNGRAWDVWWHAEDGAVFVNPASAAPCTLELTREADVLSGTFRCSGLTEEGGERRVDLRDGRFSCAVARH